MTHDTFLGYLIFCEFKIFYDFLKFEEYDRTNTFFSDTKMIKIPFEPSTKNQAIYNKLSCVAVTQQLPSNTLDKARFEPMTASLIPTRAGF